MTLVRRLILALALMAGLAPAFAQAPPAVPALPDAERRTSYTLSGSTCACAVNFAIFGDSTDVDSWIEVWIGGSRYLSTDPSHGWALSSATGAIGTIPRPITDAVLTFNAAQTGTVQIVGARRPRRATQFQEGRGVAARDLNLALTDVVAQNRETWDKINDVTGRAIVAPPGETMTVLPQKSSRAGLGMCFDTNGNPSTCVSIPSSTFTAGVGIELDGVNPTVINAKPLLGFISPLSYGVICDGAQHAGNAANFQTALNAAIAAGAAIQLPAATCVLESNITNGTGLFTNTAIVGLGITSNITFTGNNGFLLNAQAATYYFYNFAITCQQASTSACLKVSNANTNGSAIDSVFAYLNINGGTHQLEFQNANQTWVLNNSLGSSTAGTYGIYWDNSLTADAGGNLVQGNKIINTNASPGNSGIEYLNVGGTRTFNNGIDGYQYGIHNDCTVTSGSVTGINQIGNSIDDITIAGIWITTNGADASACYAHLMVNSNSIHASASGGSGSDGIVVTSGTVAAFVLDLTVNGNLISTLNGGGGVVVKGATDFTVNGNVIDDQGTPVAPAITTSTPGASCMVIGNAKNQYVTGYGGTLTCTTGGLATN